MTIADELQANLTEAMRAKDRATLDAIRNVRTEIQKAKTAPDFDGVDDDDFHCRVVAGYVKTLRKSLDSYKELGERGAEQAAKLGAEIDYLSRWLPQMLDEAATAAIVDAAIAEAGATEPGQAGKVMGMVMKAHRDDVDPAVVRRLVDARLS